MLSSISYVSYLFYISIYPSGELGVFFVVPNHIYSNSIFFEPEIEEKRNSFYYWLIITTGR